MTKFRRGYRYQMPTEPQTKEMFQRHLDLFMSKVPDHATVEVDAYTEKGDPPYAPDVKHLALVADWVDDLSKLGHSGDSSAGD